MIHDSHVYIFKNVSGVNLYHYHISKWQKTMDGRQGESWLHRVGQYGRWYGQKSGTKRS